MALTQDDVYKASYNADAQYGRDFWVGESGTGTAIREQLNRIEAMLNDHTARLQRIEDDTDALSNTLGKPNA